MIDRLRLTNHIAEWEGCKRCPIHCLIRKYVFYDLVPATTDQVKVMFIGEAPGEEEDQRGKPFVGRSGRFLRETIKKVNPEGHPYAVANILACRPTFWDETRELHKNRPPAPTEIANCAPRLLELIDIFKPLVIVTLGRVSEWHLPVEGGLILNTPHPAYILRTGHKKSRFYKVFHNTIQAAFCYKEDK